VRDTNVCVKLRFLITLHGYTKKLTTSNKVHRIKSLCIPINSHSLQILVYTGVEVDGDTFDAGRTIILYKVKTGVKTLQKTHKMQCSDYMKLYGDFAQD